MKQLQKLRGKWALSTKRVATPHLIPGTNILKNKARIDNREKLDEFSKELGEIVGELNAIHPFLGVTPTFMQ